MILKGAKNKSTHLTGFVFGMYHHSADYFVKNDAKIFQFEDLTVNLLDILGTLQHSIVLVGSRHCSDF